MRSSWRRERERVDDGVLVVQRDADDEEEVKDKCIISQRGGLRKWEMELNCKEDGPEPKWKPNISLIQSVSVSAFTDLPPPHLPRCMRARVNCI